MASLVRILALIAAVTATAALPACDSAAAPTTGKSTYIPGTPPRERITIGDEEFRLEIAATDEVRVKGLGDRMEIEEDGGMIFVFDQPQPLSFVMRDCYVPIDIAFLDAQGRVTATHAMAVEPPRGPNEDDTIYNLRLKQYGSRFDAQFALEFKAGTIERLGLKRGDQVNLATERLKRMAE